MYVYAVCMLSERLQILLSREQRARLEAEASQRETSVSSLVRDAVDARFGAIKAADRARAVEEIAAMKGGNALAPEELDRIIEAEREQEPEGR